MARKPAKAPPLPPPTAQQCRAVFVKRVLGIPVVCLGGLGIIALGLWAAGGQGLMWQTTQAMGTALFWIVGIVLMYPLLVVMWAAELRAGLRAARDWQAMPPEAQAAAIAGARAARPSRRSRKAG